jgi:hypothetical protein
MLIGSGATAWGIWSTPPGAGRLGAVHRTSPTSASRGGRPRVPRRARAAGVAVPVGSALLCGGVGSSSIRPRPRCTGRAGPPGAPARGDTGLRRGLRPVLAPSGHGHGESRPTEEAVTLRSTIDAPEPPEADVDDDEDRPSRPCGSAAPRCSRPRLRRPRRRRAGRGQPPDGRPAPGRLPSTLAPPRASTGSRGRPDLRRTVRASLRTGRARPALTTVASTRPRRVVLLADVSGSMEPYSRALVRFAHVAVAAWPGSRRSPSAPA